MDRSSKSFNIFKLLSVQHLSSSFQIKNTQVEYMGGDSSYTRQWNSHAAYLWCGQTAPWMPPCWTPQSTWIPLPTVAAILTSECYQKMKSVNSNKIHMWQKKKLSREYISTNE